MRTRPKPRLAGRRNEIHRDVAAGLGIAAKAHAPSGACLKLGARRRGPRRYLLKSHYIAETHISAAAHASGICATAIVRSYERETQRICVARCRSTRRGDPAECLRGGSKSRT